MKLNSIISSSAQQLLQRGILIFVSFSASAQQQFMIKGDDGVNRLTLQSGQHIISTIPLSFPESIINNGSDETSINEGDVRDFPARDGAAYGRAIKHVRERQIIDVQRLAGNFLAALFARNGFADGMSINHGFTRIVYGFGFVITNGFVSSSRR